MQKTDALADDERYELGRARPQGEPHPQLVQALAHQAGQDTVETERGQEER